LDSEVVRSVATAFAEEYQPPSADTEWFGQVRDLAARLGFAPNQKAYKQDPGSYKGSIRDASQVIRVLLTGTTRSPDLAAVAGVLGTDEVLRRVRAVVAP
jgi:glutamyl-tRNA synthetase